MLFPTDHGRRKSQQEFCVLQLQIVLNKILQYNSP